MNLVKNDPKTIRAWAFYDWANSAYPLVITTAIFPIFYENVAVHYSADVDGRTITYVRFFGMEFINTALYSYILALSFLVVSAITPLLSGIADYTGAKKKFLKFFCYFGSFGCAALYFFSPDYLELSMLFVIVASVGFWGSLVFYNAFLPEISDSEFHDQVSAKGFAYGYFGSSLLLIGVLVMIMFIDRSFTRFAFVLVAIWWAGFAQITYQRLPDNVFERKPQGRYVWNGYRELRNVWIELRELQGLKAFLRAFFTYSMGVQTVMLMAILFAKKEIDWQGQGDEALIISVLIIQFIAIAGALLFARLSSKIGNVNVLTLALILWTLVCVAAFLIHKPVEFYILASVVGLVMGGIQALSRSTYSKMLPETQDHASYFSFYDVIEKLAIVIGTFVFGFIEQMTSSMRNSALILSCFFLVGLILLRFVKFESSPKTPLQT